ncbi:MAG TPA: nucleotidyltransferase domain-containing protein [Pyrinomonadaceae bacterium]
MNETRISPVEAAQEIFRTRYAGARVIFLAGSVIRGEGTPASDLDLVVVYERLPVAYRESFMHGGWPVEAFVNDAETLNYFLHEADPQTGVPAMANMVLEGREIPEPCGFSQSMKELAAGVIAAGPPAWNEEDLRRARYTLTDVADDLRCPRDEAELVAAGARLYGVAADFYLRSRTLWSARGKAIPRRLREVDAEFAARFCEAFGTLFTGKRPEPVVALVKEILQPFGGLLFDGYKLDADADKRKPLD